METPTHCCDEMRREAERTCEQHPHRHECPDCLIGYVPKFREYGLLIHDGGSGLLTIRFCPWCGTKLPASLRDEWFERLRSLGLEPGDDTIPPEMHTAAWWEKK